MIRQKYMNKYKEKSLYGEERFLRENEDFLLKESRPIKETSIKKLEPKRMHQFIDDVLTDKKLTSILYATNTNIEIKAYKKLKKSIDDLKKDEERRRKKREETISIVKKKSRRDAYYQMRSEIDNYKINQINYHTMLKNNNHKKYLELKKVIDLDKKEENKILRNNRIIGFNRAYNKIAEKMDHKKDSTSHEIKMDIENNTSMVNLPNIKLNIVDVYSRLYNNAVLVTPLSKKIKKFKFNSNKTFKLKRPLTHKTTGKINVKVAPNPKMILTLKNALTSNNGKEFTINVTDQNINKCFTKYSGGPENIPYLKGKFEDKIIDDNNLDKYVDFYKLEESNTGNSYLHLATIDNYPKLVQYFLEKGADVNMQNFNGDTPLHIALKNKNMEIIKLLMNYNPALDIPNNSGVIPFELFSPKMKSDFKIDKMIVINPVKKD